MYAGVQQRVDFSVLCGSACGGAVAGTGGGHDDLYNSSQLKLRLFLSSLSLFPVSLKLTTTPLNPTKCFNSLPPLSMILGMEGTPWCPETPKQET